MVSAAYIPIAEEVKRNPPKEDSGKLDFAELELFVKLYSLSTKLGNCEPLNSVLSDAYANICVGLSYSYSLFSFNVYLFGLISLFTVSSRR